MAKSQRKDNVRHFSPIICASPIFSYDSKIFLILGWIAMLACAYKVAHLQHDYINWDPFEILGIDPVFYPIINPPKLNNFCWYLGIDYRRNQESI